LTEIVVKRHIDLQFWPRRLKEFSYGLTGRRSFEKFQESR